MPLHLLQDKSEFLADFLRPLALALHWRERWGQVLLLEDVQSGWTHICARPLQTLQLQNGRISHTLHDERRTEYHELSEDTPAQIAEILRRYQPEGQQPFWYGYAVSGEAAGLDKLHLQLFGLQLLWNKETGRSRFLQWSEDENAPLCEEWRAASVPFHLLAEEPPFELLAPLQPAQSERAWLETIARLRTACAENAAYLFGLSRLYTSAFRGDFAQLYRVLAGKYKGGSFLLDMLYQQAAGGIGEEHYEFPASAPAAPLSYAPQLVQSAIGDALQENIEPLNWLLHRLCSEWASVQGVPAREAARALGAVPATAIWAIRTSCDGQQLSAQRLAAAFWAQNGEQICAASHAFLHAATSNPIAENQHHRQKAVFDKIAEMAKMR